MWLKHDVVFRELEGEEHVPSPKLPSSLSCVPPKSSSWLVASLIYSSSESMGVVIGEASSVTGVAGAFGGGGATLCCGPFVAFAGSSSSKLSVAFLFLD